MVLIPSENNRFISYIIFFDGSINVNKNVLSVLLNKYITIPLKVGTPSIGNVFI